MKMVLNCGCCNDSVLPYNVGIFPAHQTLLGDSSPPTGNTFGMLPVRAIWWYRFRTLTPVAADDITVMNQNVFGLTRDQPLDAIWLGCVWPVPSNLTSWSGETQLRAHLGGTPNSALVDFYNELYWPADTDPEFSVIETHLSKGGDLVVHVPPLSWYAGVYNATTWDAEVPEAATALASLNIFLAALGSNTTAFGIRDSNVIDKIPRIPLNGVIPLNWPGGNLVHGITREMLQINAATAFDPPGTSTIQSSFSRPVVQRLPWHGRTYFRNADTSTYLEPVEFVQCRFATQQSFNPASISEATQLGLYVYLLTAASNPPRDSNYQIYGSGTYTAANAIRERLPSGGTLYLIPASSNSLYGTLRHQFLINLAGQALGNGLRHARGCYVGNDLDVDFIDPVSGAATRAENKVGFVSSTIVPTPGASDIYFYDHAQADEKRIWVSSPVDLQAGTTGVGVSSDGRYTQDTWVAAVNDIRFQTPDQGGSPDSKLAGPHYFVLSDSNVRTTDQHEMTLYQVGSTDEYTTRQTVSGSQLSQFIAAGMVDDSAGPYADYYAEPAFADREANATALLQPQRITGVIMQWGTPYFLRKFVAGSLDSFAAVVPVPGVFQNGKIFLPSKTVEPTNWRWPLNSGNRLTAPKYLSAYYSFSNFRNLADETETFDLSASRFFVTLMAYIVPELDWGVNGATTYYVFSNAPSFNRADANMRLDFAYRATSGAGLTGLEITITAELDTTFAAGNTITYSITITNSSENTLDVTAAASAIGYTGSFPDMAPAAVEIDTHVYTITETDVTAGLKLAVVTATADVPTGTYQAEDSVTVVAA